MSIFNQPKPPDPQQGIALGNQVGQEQQGFNTQTANQQFGFNTATAASQLPYNIAAQAGSQYNQFNPYGSLNYTQTGTGPNGVPIYSASESFSPTQSGLYNTYTQAQQAAGQGGQNLIANANYGSQSPSQAIGNMTTGTTNQILGQEVASLQPFFDIQNEQQQAKLANQGIGPGSNPTAYNNAMLPFLSSQDATVSNFLAQAEPQAFNQATTEYQMPASLGQKLAQFGAPTTPNAAFTNALPSLGAPQIANTAVSPTDVTSATSAENTALNQQYQAQQAQYNAMINGMFSLGGDVLGGMAFGGFPIGSLMGSGMNANTGTLGG